MSDTTQAKTKKDAAGSGTAKVKAEREPRSLQTFATLGADFTGPAPDELFNDMAGDGFDSAAGGVLSHEPSTLLLRRISPGQAEGTGAGGPSVVMPTFGGRNFCGIPTHASARPAIQPKLTVGAAHDPYEEEADEVAEQVMRMPAIVAAPPDGADAPDQGGNSIQRAPEEEEEVQTKPLAATITPFVQRAMPKSEDEDVQRAAEEEDELQTKRVSAADSFDTSADFEGRVKANQGGGSPLPAEVRTFMEPRFGMDFSGVRLHSGGEAGELNRSVSAQAFTLGKDIYLGEGQTDVVSDGGKQLLAHELTHVVQQGGAGAIQTKQEDHLQRAVAVAIKLPTPSKPIPEELLNQEPGSPQDKRSAESLDASAPLSSDKEQAATGTSETFASELAAGETTATDKAEITGTAAVSEPKDLPDLDNAETTSPSETQTPPAVDAEAELENVPRVAELETVSETPTDAQAIEPGANLAAVALSLSDIASPETQSVVGALEGISTDLEAGAVERQALVEQMTATLDDQTKQSEAEKVEAEKKSKKAGAELDQAVSTLQDLANPDIEFAAPQPPTPGDGPVIARTPTAAAAEDEQARTQQSARILNQFVGQNTGRSTTVLGKAQTVQQNLLGTALQVRSSLVASVQQNQGLVKQVIEGERQRVQTKATDVRTQIDSLFTTASQQLSDDKAAAVKAVEDEFKAKNDLLIAEEPTDLIAVDQKVAGTITSMRDVSTLHSSIDATQPNVDFWQGMTPEWADGADYYDRKREAARNAAQGVRDSYKTEITNKANEGADQLANSTAKTDARKTVSDQYQQSRDAMGTEKDKALTDIQQKYDTALTSITQVKAAKADALAQSLEATLKSLTDLKTTLLTQLEQQEQSQGQSTDAAAQQIAAQIQQGAATAASQLGPALNGLVEQARNIPAPDPNHLQAALAQAQAKLDAANAQLDAALGTQTGAAQQNLQQQGQQAVAGLSQTGTQAQSQATPISETFISNMDVLVKDTKTTFTATTTQHKTDVDARAQQSVTQIGTFYTDCHTGVTQILTALDQGLSQFATDFKSGPQGLDKSLANLEADILREAETAGNKIQPAWVGVLCFIGQIIISIAVAVAIGVLVASGVGLLAGLLIAAAIGAAGGIAKGMLSDIAAGENPLDARRILTNAAIGALEGALMFLGGRFINGLNMSSATWGQWAAKTAVSGGVGTVRDVIVNTARVLGEGQPLTLERFGQIFAEALVINMATEFAFGGVQQWRSVRARGAVPAPVPDASLSPSQQLARTRGMPDAPPGHEWIDNGEGQLNLRRLKGFGPTGENIPRLTYDPETGSFKSVDTGKPYVPWSKAPATPSAELAQRMGYPEPPPGYIWASNNGNPYIRRAVGLGETGKNIPELFFNPETGNISYSGSGKPYSGMNLFLDRMNATAITKNFNPYDNWTPPFPDTALQKLWTASSKYAVVKPLAYGIPLKGFESGVLDQSVPAVVGVPSSEDQRTTQLRQQKQQQLANLYASLAEAGVVSPTMNFDWNQFWADYQKQHPAP